MKKFLAVFDGLKFSKTTLEYAISLARAANAQLVGLFLDDSLYHSYPATDLIGSGKLAKKSLQELNEKERLRREESVRKFQQACTHAGIRYAVDRDTRIALLELKHESLFADLVIIQKTETFTRFKEKAPTRFIRSLLGDITCPVIIAPSHFQPIDKIILLYDGKPSSLFAIRQFSYLFGNNNQWPVEVFTVKDYYMPSMHVPDNKRMRAFINRLYPKATFTVVKGDPDEEILKFLKERPENELVVLGAYRRNEVSRWFKNSLADILMKEIETPLFVAHS